MTELTDDALPRWWMLIMLSATSMLVSPAGVFAFALPLDELRFGDCLGEMLTSQWLGEPSSLLRVSMGVSSQLSGGTFLFPTGIAVSWPFSCNFVGLHSASGGCKSVLLSREVESSSGSSG